MNKRGMELEYVVKAILGLLVLVIIAGILYIFIVKKGGGSIDAINSDTTEQGDSVLGDLRNLIGGKCEDGKEKCSMNGNLMICKEGKWETQEENCE